jgi:hypothetical protein
MRLFPISAGPVLLAAVLAAALGGCGGDDERPRAAGPAETATAPAARTAESTATGKAVTKKGSGTSSPDRAASKPRPKKARSKKSGDAKSGSNPGKAPLPTLTPAPPRSASEAKQAEKEAQEAAGDAPILGGGMPDR